MDGAARCTTFSFAVNLGLWLPPDAWEELNPKRDDQGRLRPEEYQCEPHRLHVTKSLAQPWFKPFSSDTRSWRASLRLHRAGLQKVMRKDTHDRPHIWFVRADGSNLEECLTDALRAIRDEGLPWFEATRQERDARLQAETR